MKGLKIDDRAGQEPAGMECAGNSTFGQLIRDWSLCLPISHS